MLSVSPFGLGQLAAVLPVHCICLIEARFNILILLSKLNVAIEVGGGFKTPMTVLPEKH